MSGLMSSSAPRIQVFRPTMEEFKHFSKYIEYIESTGAHKAGLAKIIPPEGWIPRKSGYDDIELFIPHPICQIVTGRGGLFQQLNISQKGMTVKEFREMSKLPKFKTPPHFDYEDLERKYWKNITYNSPIYGADVSGSLYDKGIEEFNIQHLNTILDLVKEDYEIQIEGVNTAYLYFGMWKTTFAWHTEDMDLYSINYVHYGAPKSWYVIPPEHGRRLERLAAGFFHGSHSECPSFLRHKMTIISPHILKQYSIPFSKITQEPGEFMITFPYAYHSGFNHGFNIAESTNFALPRWVEYGKRSHPCTCRNDCVKICMEIFVRKFQPDRYELWKAGKDIGAHPEDPTRQYAAPAPKRLDLALSAQREERKKDKEMQKIKRHPVSKYDLCGGKKAYKHSKYYNHESDEETKLYDVSEVLSSKSPKKRVKKSQKKESVKKVKLNKTAKKTIAKDKPKVLEVKEELGTCDEEEQIEEKDHIENKEIKMEVDDKQDCQMNTSTEEENEIELHDLKSEKSPVISAVNDANQMKEMSGGTDNPPELKPFWDPGEKFKAGNEKKCVIYSHYSDAEAQNSKMKLLESYPNLHKAVNAGAFSVVPLNPDSTAVRSWNDGIDTQTVLKEELKSKSFKPNTSEISFPLLSPTWRCEQTNNGLKIKFVQPKNSSNSSSNSSILTIHTPVESVLLEKTSSNESSVTNLQDAIELTHQIEVDDKDHNEMSQSGLTFEDDKLTHQANINNVSDDKNSPNNTSIVEIVPPQAKVNNEVHNHSSPNDSSPNEPPVGSSRRGRRAESSDTSWAQPLVNVWQHEPKNFIAEIEYNEKQACIPPHCAICVIFTPMYNKNSFPTETSYVPSYSQVKMPAFCYGNTLNSECMLDTNSLLRMDGTAPLLICSTCKVCVHATCYGVSMLPMNSWVCSRCSKQAVEAECCLCVLRGGALKPTTDGRWAHVICAVLIDEAYFEDTIQKQPINVSKITAVRQRLRCKFCFKTNLYKEAKGSCVQCRSGKCYVPYHVTCGYMAGVIFETCDWPEPIPMICTKHVAARRKPPKRELTSISVGERVIAKHRNKRYYWANVKAKYIQEYYSILFDDNSHSTNTLPEDIVSRSTSTRGTPQLNEKVRVKWPDGEIYNGTFKGSQSCELFVIEFEDGSIMRLERKEIYAADEELPKAVQSKVSHSSERRNYHFDSDIDGKRVRIINHKYIY